MFPFSFSEFRIPMRIYILYIYLYLNECILSFFFFFLFVSVVFFGFFLMTTLLCTDARTVLFSIHSTHTHMHICRYSSPKCHSICRRFRFHFVIASLPSFFLILPNIHPLDSLSFHLPRFYERVFLSFTAEAIAIEAPAEVPAKTEKN